MKIIIIDYVKLFIVILATLIFICSAQLPGGSKGGGGGDFDPSSLINPKSGGNGGFDLGNALAPFTSDSGGQLTASPPNPQEGSPSQNPAAGGNKSLANSPQSKASPPSTGSSNEVPGGIGKSNAPPPAQDIRKIAWQEKEKACILVNGPPNNTVILPESKQRISWNQSPCQMSARVVGMFHIFLYNNLQIVSDAKKRDLFKRDYSPNGKITYDWGPYPIATNLTNTTNNYDWIAPYLNYPRITNDSNFFIRVETISRSGIFGQTPPLGGIYGPFSIELHDPPPGWNETANEKTALVSSGQKVKPNILPSSYAIRISIINISHWMGSLIVVLVILNTLYLSSL